MAYAWSEPTQERHTARIPEDRPVYLISDLHLGDGEHSDIFMGKDRQLLALLDQVRQENARLVIAGDAIDFHQAWNMTRILQAHGKLLRAFSELADSNGVSYLYGNHDHDIRIYRDILRFNVCTELMVGDSILVQHGHEFDPFIGPHLHATHTATRVHHAVERFTGQFLRMPISDFYNWGMRLGLWLGYYFFWKPIRFRNAILKKIGLGSLGEKPEFVINHWVRSEAGDPVGMTLPALQYAKKKGLKALICGHSHMPGNVEADGVRYINTGSWTFNWAQYTVLKDGVFTVKDWVTGREYKDELYRPLLDGELDGLDFERWWRNQYLGWGRFRSGEARRVLTG
jgi:UDP-2,3-diacylglucosamine pyrophosphatase LpxH